jgi:endonuclease YncB( thermonuclease family)
MKTILAAVVAVFAMMGAASAQKQPTGVTYDTQIIRVSDGDTIVISARFLPAPLKPELAVRIFGVDTPEKGHRAQCPAEAQRGEQASQWTKALVASGTKFQVTLYGWDKFGGRVLGDILVDGKSVRSGLIAAGLAREYYGEAKQSWCQ